MPLPPILSRTMFYDVLRDGSLRIMDFHLVNTSLGAMIEPRTLIRASGAMVNEDPYDSAVTDIQRWDESLNALVEGIGDAQWPRNFNTQ